MSDYVIVGHSIIKFAESCEFLPRDATYNAVVLIIMICPSVTLVHRAHTVQSTIIISLPYGSPMILVFWAKFRLHTPTAWPSNSTSNTSGVGKNVVFNIKTA